MTDFEAVARNINERIDYAIDDLSEIFQTEEKNMDIVSVINQMRSSEVKDDALSSFTLESQALIVSMLTTETASLQELQGQITSEGRTKNANRPSEDDESSENEG